MFVYSQLLTACIELHLFSLLVTGSLTFNDLAERPGIALEASMLLVEPMSGTPGATRIGYVHFGFYL